MCVRLWFRISPREVREVQAGWQVLHREAASRERSRRHFHSPFSPDRPLLKERIRKASSSLLSPTVLFARFRALRFMKKHEIIKLKQAGRMASRIHATRSGSHRWITSTTRRGSWRRSLIPSLSTCQHPSSPERGLAGLLRPLASNCD